MTTRLNKYYYYYYYIKSLYIRTKGRFTFWAELQYIFACFFVTVVD